MPLEVAVAWATMKGLAMQRMTRKRLNQANRVLAVDIRTPTETGVNVPPEIARRKLKLFMGAIGIRNGKAVRENGSERTSIFSWRLLPDECRRASSRQLSD